MSACNSINAALGLGAYSSAIGNQQPFHAASSAGKGQPVKTTTSSPDGNEQRVETSAVDASYSMTDRNQLFMIGMAMIGVYIIYNSSK
jgi:hypothetical protein